MRKYIIGKQGGNKKVKVAVLLLAAICLFALATPVMAISVTRSLSTTSPSPNSEFDVTLTISDPIIGGIVETLPDGFTYVNTTHPADQVNLSGQKIVFVVINETEIKYNVKAPSAGSGTFTGIWENLLSGTNGTIAETGVSVSAPIVYPVGGGGGGGAAPTPTPTPVPTPTPTPMTEFQMPEVPGFEAASMIVALSAVYLLVFRRRGK